MQAQLLHHTVHSELKAHTWRVRNRVDCIYFGDGLQFVMNDDLWRQDTVEGGSIVSHFQQVISYKHTLKYISRYVKCTSWNETLRINQWIIVTFLI
jgi:hypothetical protein